MLQCLLNMGCAIIFAVLLIAIISWVTILAIERKKSRTKCNSYICRMYRVLKYNIKRDIIPCAIIAAFIIGVVLLIVRVSIGDFSQGISWDNVKQFFSTHSVTSSVTGTFIGLILIFIFLRPRLYIDDLSTYILLNGKTALRVQAYNMGFFDVQNVTVQLHWYRDPAENKRKSKKIDLFRPTTPIIKGYYTGEKTNSYACHVRHHYMGWNKDYEGLRCRVIATHSLSGITRVYERFYTREEVEQATSQK